MQFAVIIIAGIVIVKCLAKFKVKSKGSNRGYVLFFLFYIPLGEAVLYSGRAETDSHRSLDLIISVIFPANGVQEAPGFHLPADSLMAPPYCGLASLKPFLAFNVGTTETLLDLQQCDRTHPGLDVTVGFPSFFSSLLPSFLPSRTTDFLACIFNPNRSHLAAAVPSSCSVMGVGGHVNLMASLLRCCRHLGSE